MEAKATTKVGFYSRLKLVLGVPNNVTFKHENENQYIEKKG